MNETEPPPPPAPPPPTAWSAACVLCESPRESIDARCPVCGLHPGLGPTERDPFDRAAITMLIVAFVVIYVLVFIIAAVTN